MKKEDLLLLHPNRMMNAAISASICKQSLQLVAYDEARLESRSFAEQICQGAFTFADLRGENLRKRKKNERHQNK